MSNIKEDQANFTNGFYLETHKRWEKFSNWIHCICVVTFDLELGQALESIYPPHVTLTKQETLNICYLAFPDSNSGCMGDTNFIVRLQSCPSKAVLSNVHTAYNSKCPPALQINPAYYWGYVYFRQVKDIKLPRGYFQKSVVILSRLPFNNLFTKIISVIAPEYFDNGNLSLEAACYNIDQWPTPVPGLTLSLPLLGSVFQTFIPHQRNSTSLILQLAGLNEVATSSENQIQASVEDLNLFDIFQPVLSHIDMLWELVITAEPLIVMASSPNHCSLMVLALTRIISPLKFCADHRTYFTIHDSDFKQFTNKVHGTPPVILGVTNPFFAKTLHHWPHTVRLGQYQKYKLKKNGNSKIFDSTPGVYSSYKPFLQKDKTMIKNLISGINTKRPFEVQSALLKKHLLELTHSFMIPLERYIASLMPLLKNISPFRAAPTPLPFNPDDFFAMLETAGPQLTTGIKGDWVGLYKKFFRSPNFNGWFNNRYTELALKLQALQLQALSDADLKLWVQGKPEVEIVDMVLKIKNKIKKCEQHDIPVSHTIKEQLEQRLQDIISSLPDDLKNILQTS
ncbi:PREDICTED: protein DENND6B isoform X2 [Nicrophorus vespilloides]|uniref:Protein DENND6B isoform X2 n=1 Tax=Nicrophorus vespilloides TaxID=110193 RepID=A0ABM1M1L8_NICVS|nr:PREDICTED: protein DENND6B isoform X2 [Nicrophorus vespilloides]